MLINLPGLKTLDILIMFIVCPRHYMGSSKPGWTPSGFPHWEGLHHREGRHHTIHQEAWWRDLHLSSICWWYHIWIIKWRLLQRVWWIDVKRVQDDVAQRVQGARGLAVGGTTLDTHGRPHGLRPQGWPSPQDEVLWGTTLLGASRKTPRRYPEDTA